MADLIRMSDPAIIAVRCLHKSLDAADTAFGTAFPRAVNRFVARDGLTIAAVGPDDWLVIADSGHAGPLVEKLEQALAGHHAAVVDISGNRVRYRLQGDDTAAALARGCALDLDRLKPGDCTGTMLARAQIYLLQRSAAPSFEFFPRRSFEGYLRAWFENCPDLTSISQ